MQNQNCNHSQPNRYRYKGFWIRVFLEADFERDEGGTLSCDHRILYNASVELPNKCGVISGEPKESRHEAEFAAEELIDSWN